jgi:hypothetical protein
MLRAGAGGHSERLGKQQAHAVCRCYSVEGSYGTQSECRPVGRPTPGRVCLLLSLIVVEW